MDLHKDVSLELPASALHLTADRAVFDEGGIVVRPLALTDAPGIVEAIRESRAELMQYMPWAHHPQTLATQRHRIVGAIHSYWMGDDFTLGIFAAASGQFLGGTGLHKRALHARALEIGYWIRTEAAGKGLATLVTRGLIAYGFAYLGLQRVQCGHDAANLGSARVNDKCGFKIEGRLRNFDTPGTDEMRKHGWAGTGEIVLRGLCPEDIPSLPWYGETLRRLTVFDWLGKSVATG